MLRISVVICTYNPLPDVFSSCLEALSVAIKKSQPQEIIIVDNNSTTPLAQQGYIKNFLSLHSNASLINEPEQGLTPARLRGVKESKAEVLVFVDDDNVVAPDFLEQGKLVAENNPHIGAWSGQVKLKFEKEPESWTRKYWGLLVHREFDSDYWSNLPHLATTMPCGAGLFIRRPAAEYYLRLHESGKRNIMLDRKGKSLFSGGDNDMAACACDIGLGVGLFHKIAVTHYIPAFRLEKEYLLKLAEGIAASSVVFRSFRGEFATDPNLKNKLAYRLRWAIKNRIDKSFYQAVTKGENLGRALVKQSAK